MTSYRVWEREGREVRLSITTQKAIVSVFGSDGQTTYYRLYEWWQAERATTDAEALADFAGAQERYHAHAR